MRGPCLSPPPPHYRSRPKRRNTGCGAHFVTSGGPQEAPRLLHIFSSVAPNCFRKNLRSEPMSEEKGDNSLFRFANYEAPSNSVGVPVPRSVFI